MKSAFLSTLLSALLTTSYSLTISEIQGAGFGSQFVNQAVTDVTGVVTAIGPLGFWLRSTTPDDDIRTSESVYVFTTASATSIRRNVTVGEIVTIDGKVEEYRSDRAHMFLTEITGPKNLRKTGQTAEAKPIQLGKDRSPPTELYSSLDTGNDVFAVPNNSSLIENSKVELQPELYGLDFWESLEGELVTVKRPRALNMPNNFGDVWVRGGDWKVTGENRRGGLTILPGKEGNGADANPEAIIVGEPLDGTKNLQTTRFGDYLEDITGVVTYAFGFYRILPTTAMKVRKAVTPATAPPTQFVTDNRCYLTFGSYNVENLEPKSEHLGEVAAHIVTYLKTPDVVFLQEVQDNDGPTNTPITSANITLQTLADAIFELSGVAYNFIDMPPVDDQDGGQPGGNIRVAYFYNPENVELSNPNPGKSTDAVAILPNGDLNFNPGRIEPTNTAAWSASRKPLVVAFEAKNAKEEKKEKIYAINVHFGSKGGSSSLHGNPRPPVNGGVGDRLRQAELVAKFISSVYAAVPNANIIAAGDFNEFSMVAPMKVLAEANMHDLDEVVNIKLQERYTYLFDGNSQQLDHMLVSDRLRERARFEHIHVNTWANSRAEQVSDHDPSVAKLAVCHY